MEPTNLVKERARVYRSNTLCNYLIGIAVNCNIGPGEFEHPVLINSCFYCPFYDCVLIGHKDRGRPSRPINGEIYILCQACKTLETVTVIDNVLDRYRRFIQGANMEIWHLKLDLSICGPCRIVK